MDINNKLLRIIRLGQNVRRFHCSKLRNDSEGSGKMTVSIINSKSANFCVTACTPIGFKLNIGGFMVGPMALFPKSIFCWNIGSGKDINQATLSLFTILEPTLDILVLGLETTYGEKKYREIKDIIGKDIRLELLPVDRACGVYNFLCEEGRHVAAGLIPPLVEDTFVYKKLQSSMKSIEKSNLITSGDK